jgi:multidrug efflux pump subunit AcrA (membrane-fusion protein)
MLKPEVYVNIEIKVPVGNFLTIPSDSVLDTGTRQIVFIDKGEGVFEPRKVILGEKIDDYYVLKSGISEHEKVVTSANFLIDSESQLKSALKQMTAEHKH